MTGGVVLPSKNKAAHEYTLEELQNITKTGKANEYFSVGDIVGPVMLNGTVGDVTLTDYPAYFIIVGIDHLIEIEKPGYHTLTLQFGKSGLEDDAKFISLHGYFQPDNTTVGGWAASKLKTYCSQFKSCLPTAWQEAIIPVTKYTDNVGQDPNYTGELYEKVTPTIEEVFLPNVIEQNGYRTSNISFNIFENLTVNDTYPTIDTYSAYSHDNLSQKITHNFLRSPYTLSNSYYIWNTLPRVIAYLNENNNNNGSSDYVSGIQPCFCIGGVATDSPTYSTDEYMLKSEFEDTIRIFQPTWANAYLDMDYYFKYTYTAYNNSMFQLISYYVGTKYKKDDALEILNQLTILNKWATGELTETPGKIEPILQLDDSGDFYYITRGRGYSRSGSGYLTYNGDGIVVVELTSGGAATISKVSDGRYYVSCKVPAFETGEFRIHAYEGQQYASKTITIYVDTED